MKVLSCLQALPKTLHRVFGAPGGRSISRSPRDDCFQRVKADSKQSPALNTDESGVALPGRAAPPNEIWS